MDKLIHVKAMKDLEYHPPGRPDLTKRYEKANGERPADEFDVEPSAFSDYDSVPVGYKCSKCQAVTLGRTKILEGNRVEQPDPAKAPKCVTCDHMMSLVRVSTGNIEQKRGSMRKCEPGRKLEALPSAEEVRLLLQQNEELKRRMEAVEAKKGK